MLRDYGDIIVSPRSLNGRVSCAYHRDENAKLWIESDVVPVRKDEVVLPIAFGKQYDGNLLSGHWEHREFDSVELVEAAPGTGLGKTLEDAAETAEIHLVGAVEHDHVLAKAPTHVLQNAHEKLMLLFIYPAVLNDSAISQDKSIPLRAKMLIKTIARKF